MNVNKSGDAAPRIRRTPDQARQLILDVAARRLQAHGLDGLGIAAIAADAGMSHASVIHHFGSTAGMREALLMRLTGELLAEVKAALALQETPDVVLDRLFKTLSQGKHGLLLAWRAVEQQSGLLAGDDGNSDLFAEITQTLASELGESEARQRVYLVALAAMGLSIGGNALHGLVGLSAQEAEAFPAWLGRLLSGDDAGAN